MSVLLFPSVSHVTRNLQWLLWESINCKKGNFFAEKKKPQSKTVPLFLLSGNLFSSLIGSKPTTTGKMAWKNAYS